MAKSKSKTKKTCCCKHPLNQKAKLMVLKLRQDTLQAFFGLLGNFDGLTLAVLFSPSLLLSSIRANNLLSKTTTLSPSLLAHRSTLYYFFSIMVLSSHLKMTRTFVFCFDDKILACNLQTEKKTQNANERSKTF